MHPGDRLWRHLMQSLCRRKSVMKIPDHIKLFWRGFLNSDSCPNNANDLFQASYKIGSNESGANEGAKLILSCEKTATSRLLWDLEKNGEPLPKVGDLCVIEDGSGKPVCVVQTTWVETIRFRDLDAGFARDYSETDGTLEDWYRVFGEYYSEECTAMNRVLTDETPLVCQRFQVIYSR